MEELDLKRWAAPFYLDFLHGSFTNTKCGYSITSSTRRGWGEWRDLLRHELQQVTPEIAGDLMMDADWRTQICGAYFCGLNRWKEFTLDVGRLLVRKRNMFATQGYAFALARMPSHAAANALCSYLERVGHPRDTTDWYSVDLEWVVAALEWVDEQMGTHRIEPYLEKLVPYWQKRRFANLQSWYREMPEVMSGGHHSSEKVEGELSRLEKELDSYFLPDDGSRKREWFWELMAFCEEHFDEND